MPDRDDRIDLRTVTLDHQHHGPSASMRQVRDALRGGHRLVRTKLDGRLSRPSDVSAEGDCSFCGAHETYPIVGSERLRGATEERTVTGQAVRICSLCVERAAAATRPS